jgi:hypothetical protein
MGRQLGVVVDVENDITQFLGYDNPTCCYIEIGILTYALLLICAPRIRALQRLELQVPCSFLTHAYCLGCCCATLRIRF